MNNIRNVSFLSLFLLLGIDCHANANQSRKNGLSETYKRCIDHAGGITANLNDCVGTEQIRLDNILNLTYQNVMRSLSSTRRMEQGESERRWLHWRDRHCWPDLKMAGIDYYGTLDVLSARTCLLDVTAKRIDWLSAHYRR